jgi:hypothetical protein
MKKNMYLGLILGPGRGRGMKKEEEFWVVKWKEAHHSGGRDGMGWDHH